MKSIVFSLVSFILFGLGISLQIKAAVGQSMLNAFALTLSDLSNIEVGTILSIINLSFFIAYLAVKRMKIDGSDVVQIAATIANGYVINFFVYRVLDKLIIEFYLLRIAVLLLGMLISYVNLGQILAIGIIKFPLESLCISISEKLNKQLTWVRMKFDVFFLTVTIVITIITGNTLHIREGTILSFLLLSKLLGFFYGLFKRYWDRNIPARR